MNEGVSAGGGHQGFNPDPPAVPDCISNSVTTTSTTSATIATTAPPPQPATTITATEELVATSSIVNTSQSVEQFTTETPTEVFEIVTSASSQHSVIPVTVANSSNTLSRKEVGPIPKSFQQAFAQHSLQPVAACKACTPSTYQHLQLNSRLTHMSETPICYSATTIGVNGINTIITKVATSAAESPTATVISTGNASLVSSIRVTPKHSVKRRKLEDCSSTVNTIHSLEKNLPINLSLLPITTTTTVTKTNNNSNYNKNNSSNNNNINNYDQNILTQTTCSLNNPNRNVIVNADNQKFTNGSPDIQALKKRILEYNYLRLRSLKEKHSENVAELFYLHNGGNMMDYPTWRKEPPTEQFVTFSNTYRLDQLVNAERLAATPATTTIIITAAATTTTTTETTITTSPSTTIEITTTAITTPVIVITTTAAITTLTAKNSNNIQRQEEQKYLHHTTDNIAKITGVSQQPQEQQHQQHQKKSQQLAKYPARTNANSALTISSSVTVPSTVIATANKNHSNSNNLSTKSYERSNNVISTVSGGTVDGTLTKPMSTIEKAIDTTTTHCSNKTTTATLSSVCSKIADTPNHNQSQSHNQNKNITKLSTIVDVSRNALPPQGAEIKIPAVGATPVAVSTKLPAAVQQLTQQGHIPGRPVGGRHGMVFGQIPAQPAVGNSSVPLVPGGTPLIPCSTAQGATTLRRNGNNSMVTSNTPPPLYSTTSGGLLVTTNSVGICNDTQGGTVGSGNCSQENNYKAKQEVDIMRRVMELQREGLWSEKRLPKQLEPTRPKAHWDYLLEEMVWLAADFAQERKWKKAAAKKCAKMVQKYFQDKTNAALKAEKAQEAHLRRVAAFIAKEVKMFWSNVEKLVEYKHQTKIEEKRKKALDQHLSFIVDQTEKFSQQLAEGMNKPLIDACSNSIINSSCIASPKKDNIDDEFRPESTSDDDEETIAKAEEEDMFDVDAEVAALKKESLMDLDDFLKDLPEGYLENRERLVKEEENKTKPATSPFQNQIKSDSEDGDFKAMESSEDDEITIIKQEAEEMDVDHQKELNQLDADNNLTVAELLEKYKAGEIDEVSGYSSKPRRFKHNIYTKMDVDSDGDDGNNASETRKKLLDSDDESTVSEDNVEEEEQETDTSTDEDEDHLKGDEDSVVSDQSAIHNLYGTQAEDEDTGLRSLLLDDASGNNNKDDIIKGAAALAESLQPKGNTLSSTNVVTPVPFLLKHSLREYQHIGLDWLVTMYERKLNGILADEMGLGKTIQTIALLAHLACVKGNWGPHLIIVPSSVMLNWEMEFKKWCPGFKLLTYYGTQKERKMKRVGWTKANAFHVCITSYKLVVQDQQSFRRKKWKYLILDEAQNIKNFKSHRWQLLLHFSTERRLLLTGTPLQNDLMELWSLMHFLMPYVFSSHREFKEWFSNPMTGMIEGNMEYNDQLIQRLHKVIRPFLLRRLKKEVEKQMPKKYEHVIMCRLSNRQRYLYDDFMCRAKTKETLQTGNLLSVINVLMQLRKVCNHPNMFEVRPTISPFQMEGIIFETSRLICDLMEYNPFTHISLFSLNVLLIELELTLTAYVSHKSRLLAASSKLIEEVDNTLASPPRCPPGKYKFHIRIRDVKIQQNLRTHSTESVKVGASPAMKAEGNKFVPINRRCSNIHDQANSHINKRINNTINPLGPPKVGPPPLNQINTTVSLHTNALRNNSDDILGPTPAKMPRLNNAKNNINIKDSGSNTSVCANVNISNNSYVKTEKSEKDEITLVNALVQQVKSNLISNGNSNNKTRPAIFHHPSNGNMKTETLSAHNTNDDNCVNSKYKLKDLIQQRKKARLRRLKVLATVNKRRVEAAPIYGSDCRASLEKCTTIEKNKENSDDASYSVKYSTWGARGYMNCCAAMARSDNNWTLNDLLKSYIKRCEELKYVFENFVIYVPSACAPRIQFYVNNLSSTMIQQQHEIDNHVRKNISPKLGILHSIMSAMTTQFPDPRLIQYDCGKLQTLDRLLKQLKTEHHRVLIFTQMTKMLDVLEAFLNYHGHIYLRLDGATKVEERQLLMERFNSDKRIFCFILSTRSGGVGINLTGADTVIFYDSDWNPTMDAQAQDRCHRIGQTRDVHIYRLVSEKTIEVNILKKANQKRMLSDMAIEGGNFTASYFKSSTIKDLFNVETSQANTVDTTASASVTITSALSSASNAMNLMSDTQGSTAVNSEKSGTLELELEKQSLKVFEQALAAAEDEQDVQATKTAKAEVAADLAEFDENIPLEETAINTENVGEMSRADLEMQNLVKQLSPIERYAMRFVEETGAAWTAEQLRAAEEKIEAQKREWEANRLAVLHKEEEMLNQETEAADEILTYNRKDATNQVNRKTFKRSSIQENNSNKHKQKRTLRQGVKTFTLVKNATTTSLKDCPQQQENKKLLLKRQSQNLKQNHNRICQTTKHRPDTKRQVIQTQNCSKEATTNNRKIKFRNHRFSKCDVQESEVESIIEGSGGSDIGKNASSVEKLLKSRNGNIKYIDYNGGDTLDEDGNIEIDVENVKKYRYKRYQEEVSNSQEGRDNIKDKNLQENNVVFEHNIRELEKKRCEKEKEQYYDTFIKKSDKNASSNTSTPNICSNSRRKQQREDNFLKEGLRMRSSSRLIELRSIKRLRRKSLDVKKTISETHIKSIESNKNSKNKGDSTSTVLSFVKNRLRSKRNEQNQEEQNEQELNKTGVKRKVNGDPIRETNIKSKPLTRSSRLLKNARLRHRLNSHVLGDNIFKDNRDKKTDSKDGDWRNKECYKKEIKRAQLEGQINKNEIAHQKSNETKQNKGRDNVIEVGKEVNDIVSQQLIAPKIQKTKALTINFLRGGKNIQSLNKKNSCDKNYDDFKKNKAQTNETENNGHINKSLSCQRNENSDDEKSTLVSIEGNSSSMDTWNAHNQLGDTTTNSTYYNVSEESDSDDNHALISSLTHSTVNTTSTSVNTVNASISCSLGKKAPIFINNKSVANNTTVKNSTISSNDGCSSAYINKEEDNECIDNNYAPRTRSRCSVKINLWTLDESPILSTTRSCSNRYNRKDITINEMDESNDSATNNMMKLASSTPTTRSAVKRITKNVIATRSSETLHKWLLKTTRSDGVNINDVNNAEMEAPS